MGNDRIISLIVGHEQLGGSDVNPEDDFSYVFSGNIDFAVLLRASSREELKEIVDAFIKIEEVERSNTYLILDRIKEDTTVQL